MAEGQILYDGLGNPVGFSFLKRAFRAASKLAPLASLLPVPGAGLLTQVAQRALPGIIRQLAPAARRLQRVLPAGVVQQFAPVAQAFQQAVPAAAPPEDVEGFYGEAVPGQPMRPLPPGWIPRPSPYLGTKGRRVYLRCVSWRGPKGLVPAICRTGATGAGSHSPTPTSPAAAGGHGTAICSPPPALVRSPVRRQVYAQEPDK